MSKILQLKASLLRLKSEVVEVNGTKYLVKIYNENRNNSRVSIGKRAINIRLPLFLNREERFKQLLKMKAWARKKLEENPRKFMPTQQKRYKDRDMIKIGDDEYKLRIDFKNKQSSSAKIVGNTIFFSISSNLSEKMQNKSISALLSRCIANKRLPKLKEKINELNKSYFNREIKNIFFKHNKSNWGSCSRAGNINISTRLLFAPEDVLEYVCVHELVHLIEQNHSEKFWSLVKKAMPDYKEKERWLKENSNKCQF